MSTSTVETGGPVTLRDQAVQQLALGTAPASRSPGIGVDALALLHRLASTPASAADALKLLHELQVHQVELDLQQAQIEATNTELAGELAYYRALFEQSPVAHFVLDAGGRVVECNRAGADRLAVHASEVSGRRFDEFLSVDSRLALAVLLRDVQGGAENACCMARPARAAIASQRWSIVANARVAADRIQLVVTDGAAGSEA
jgi:PAS domain S-box-containing protein